MYVPFALARVQKAIRRRAGREECEPLYTVQDAENTFPLLTSCRYEETISPAPGISFTMTDAGHLLGSACIAMDLTENGVKKRIVFSGDLGNIKQPIIRDPVHFHGADYVVMEAPTAPLSEIPSICMKQIM